MSYGVPVGAAKGVTGLKAVGQAAGKGAIAGGMGGRYRDWETDRKSTRLNSSHITRSRMPSSA